MDGNKSHHYKFHDEHSTIRYLHPCTLDPGSPCWDDELDVFQVLIIFVLSGLYLTTRIKYMWISMSSRACDRAYYTYSLSPIGAAKASFIKV